MIWQHTPDPESERKLLQGDGDSGTREIAPGAAEVESHSCNHYPGTPEGQIRWDDVWTLTLVLGVAGFLCFMDESGSKQECSQPPQIGRPVNKSLFSSPQICIMCIHGDKQPDIMLRGYKVTLVFSLYTIQLST